MITIRRISPSEGPAFRAIRARALADSPSAFGSTLEELLSRPPEYWEQRARDSARGEDSVLFVAEINGEWVGLAGGYRTDEGGEPEFDLISMWVDPEHRGKGLGSRLVEQVAAWARSRGAPRLYLWVTENNHFAIALYRRCGFQETGETQSLPSNSALREQQMVLEV